MKTFKYTIFLLMLFCLDSATTEAKKKLQPVYLVGYAFSPLDSTAYITEIQYMDSTWVDSKNKTLYYRTNYTAQLQGFLEGKMNATNMVCAVFFDKKKARIEKKLQRINRFQPVNAVQKLDAIPSDIFRFQTENWTEEGE